jgi:glycosyltransferase involved in cell wall biosynthesis
MNDLLRPRLSSAAVSLTIGMVVPTLRAEATLGGVLRAIPAGVAHVFVVDDASPDGSARVAESLGDSRVRVIRHEANRGVGGAVKTGYRAALDAGCDVIVKMDADGQMDPLHLDDLIRPLRLGQAGYAKGNRLRSLVEQRAATAGTVMVAALPFLLGVQFLVQAVVLDIGEVRDCPPLPPLD